MILVSVIMSVYNSKNVELLKKSIESILNQTIKNFEFIICNDCSTNVDIEKILNFYKQKDKRIVLIKNECNLGLAKSLNNCLKIAKGYYIARQDDDDISHCNRFEKEINFLEKNKNYVLVGCNLNLFNDKLVWGIRTHKEKPTKKDFIHGSQFAHPATIIKKDVLESIGGYKISKITNRTEDYELYMRLYSYGYIGYNIQEQLYDYYECDKTYKQQKFKYRLNEAIVMFNGLKSLGLLPKYFIYCFKPILSGLTPLFIKKIFKSKKYKKQLLER